MTDQEAKVYNAVTIDGAQYSVVVIQRQNDTMCKPNLRELPLQQGRFPHICANTEQSHFDTGNSKEGYGSISGTSIVTNLSGTTIIFPYGKYFVFTLSGTATIAATSSEGNVTLTATPECLCWLYGYDAEYAARGD